MVDTTYFLFLHRVSDRNALTRTCRQIRSETHATFYASYEFHESTPNFRPSSRTRVTLWLGNLCALLRLLGPDILVHAKRLRVDLHAPLNYEHSWSMTILGRGQAPIGQAPSMPPSNPEHSDECWVQDLRDGRNTLLAVFAGMGLNVEYAPTLVGEQWEVSKTMGVDAQEVVLQHE